MPVNTPDQKRTGLKDIGNRLQRKRRCNRNEFARDVPGGMWKLTERVLRQKASLEW